MDKINLVVIAVAVMLAPGPLNAADPEKTKQKEDTNKSVGNSSAQEAAYLAAVKRCEGSEAKEKQRCVETVKERYGEMLR